MSDPVATLVSPRVGLVTELAPQMRGPEEPVPPHLYTATLAHFDFQMAPRRDRLNAGKGRTEQEARHAALGEAAERYSAYHWDPRRVWVGKAEPGAITPTDCVLYSPAQYAAGRPYPEWTPDSEISWVRGVELPSGEPVAVPAALTYLVHPPPLPADLLTASTSNGLAAGPDLPQAILGGFYEVIERDALLITWMNRLPATEIALPDRGCYTASVIRHYRHFQVAIRLFLLATDQAPHVVMAVAEDPAPDRPARVVGLGCDLDPVASVDKAVFELCQARPSETTRFRENPTGEGLDRYEDVADIDDHPAFHAQRRNLGEFDFLTAGDQSVELHDLPRPETGDPEARLATVVDGIVKAGARAAYVDITAPDVAQAGIAVARCFATGLQPIHFGWGEARLGGKRLFEAPVSWGMASRQLAEEELNPCPHPLA